ncbi:Hsp20/alpha crystallin family protein [Rhodococcus sp. NPDC003348]
MGMLSPHRPTQPPSIWPAMPDWSDLVARFESMSPWTAIEGHMIRVEEHLAEGRYTLRAELPGVDPAKDVDISVRDGQLTIKAERTERQEEGLRSEFHYGSFYRSMPLPAGANEDAIDATYADGILTVTVPVAEAPAPAKHVEIKAGGEAGK